MSNTSSEHLFAAALKAKTVDTAGENAATAIVAASAPVVPAVVVSEPEAADEAPAPKVTELDMLKQRARLMGLTFSNNIGADSLKAKIDAKLAGEAEVADDETEDGEEAADLDDDDDHKEEPVRQSAQASNQGRATKARLTPEQEKAALRQSQYAEQMRLVRVRITNLNPAKKDLPGEIFTVANRVLGAVRKYIPYGEVTDNGYHIPFWILTQLKEREFQNIKTRKDSRGRTTVETGMAREFSIEVLPPLTEIELARLAAAQAAAQGLE